MGLDIPDKQILVYYVDQVENPWPKEDWARMKQKSKEHIKYCMMLYGIQQDNGMYFLHEQP